VLKSSTIDPRRALDRSELEPPISTRIDRSGETSARRWACRPRSCATDVVDRSTTGSCCESWTNRGTSAASSAASVSSRSTDPATSRTASSTANPTTNGLYVYTCTSQHYRAVFVGGSAVRSVRRMCVCVCSCDNFRT